MKLVVVESPAKAKTIEKYLGSGHRVLASFGHVRDLPPKDGSVDPDHGFAMQWQVSPDRSKQLKAIADEARNADTLILATDPDREGEAIACHLAEQLKIEVEQSLGQQRAMQGRDDGLAVFGAQRLGRDVLGDGSFASRFSHGGG